MATETDQTVIADKCLLCDELYNNINRIAHVLYCKHSLCLVCLWKLCNADAKLINCPFCKVDSKLYAKGTLDGILVESSIFTRTEKKEKTKKEEKQCEFCEDQHVASFYCLQCEQVVFLFILYCDILLIFKYVFTYMYVSMLYIYIYIYI